MHPRTEADASGVVALDHRRGNALVPAQRAAHRLSLWRWRRATVLLCLGLWFVLPCGAAQDAGESAIPGWPKDAPIQVRTRRDEVGIGQVEAEELAARYLGGAAGELKLQRAFLTDDDFPYLRPRNLPVWLAEATGLSIPFRNAADPPQAARKPEFLPTLYLTIDAATGQCVEAFSPPRTEWWREVRPIGSENEKWYRMDGTVFDRPSLPPGVSLRQALQGARLSLEAAGQMIARYVLYSEFSSGVVVERLDGPGLIPPAVQESAWVVIREGVELTPTMPDEFEYVGCSRWVLSATTGRCLSNCAYGNPRARRAN